MQGTPCGQKMGTQQKQKDRVGKKPNEREKSQVVQTHFEVQGPEFRSINYFTNVLVSLIKDQRFLPEKAVGRYQL